MARVPGVCATTRALATSQTLTRVSSVGSVWSASRSVARSAVVIWQAWQARSTELLPEDPVDDGAGPAGGAEVVVHHLVGTTGPVAEDGGDRGAFPRVAGH